MVQNSNTLSLCLFVQIKWSVVLLHVVHNFLPFSRPGDTRVSFLLPPSILPSFLPSCAVDICRHAGREALCTRVNGNSPPAAGFCTRQLRSYFMFVGSQSVSQLMPPRLMQLFRLNRERCKRMTKQNTMHLSNVVVSRSGWISK